MVTHVIIESSRVQGHSDSRWGLSNLWYQRLCVEPVVSPHKSDEFGMLLVHVIEARDVVAKNLDNTSAPIIYVSAFGQTQHTTAVKGVRSIYSWKHAHIHT